MEQHAAMLTREEWERLKANEPRHWICPKCKQPCGSYQTALDGWRAIYSLCCQRKIP